MPSRTLAALTVAVMLTATATACSDTEDSGGKGNLTYGTAIDDAPTGELIADSGFRPETNGFGFENYGGGDETNLTSQEVHNLFGDAVCIDAETESCELIPQAEAWMEHTNKSMDAGHCYGMSLTSLQMWQQTLNASDYGADTTPELAKEDNQPLQSVIAQNFATQYGAVVKQQMIKGTPGQIVDRLIQAWSAEEKEGMSLGFYKRDGSGGHEITPYAIEKAGDGQVNILVYDNNYPGVTQKVRVDLTRDTWEYKTTTKPGEPVNLYEGDAETRTLELTPVEAVTEIQPCSFCGRNDDSEQSGKGSAKGEPAADIKLVYLDGDAANHPHLLLTDDAGRRTGYVDGELVNEIPGAAVGKPKGGKPGDDPEPEYTIPGGNHFTITVDGGHLTKDVKDVQVGIIYDAFDVAAEQIQLRKGAKDVFDVSADMSKFGYTASDTVSPVVHFGASISDDEYLTFNVSNSADVAGSTMSAELPLDGKRFGRFILDTSKVKGDSAAYGIEVIYQDKKDEIRFTTDDVEMNTGAKAAVRWDKVNEKRPYMPLLVQDAGERTWSKLEPAVNE
ncbi:hypothetical protein [Nonomuraea sp. NPDC003804]|uniref:hypothetical protein n=1 Tax=Nonomuraea sp. NPDC003804 TaxID=3154547 RepID=UPI0033A2BA06